jgi:tRNA1(Val) A37 N6-methylase TrmN6
MLPPSVMEKLSELAFGMGFNLHERCRVKHNAEKPVHLVFAVFSRVRQELISEEEIVLKEGDSYSRKAKELLEPYYLFL